jgi:hypothetical protein
MDTSRPSPPVGPLAAVMDRFVYRRTAALAARLRAGAGALCAAAAERAEEAEGGGWCSALEQATPPPSY